MCASSEAAADEELPAYLPIRAGIDNRLTGQPLTRLDLPAKVDGSAPFAGDAFWGASPSHRLTGG